MASQISHIPYSKKVKDLFLFDQIIDEKKFFVGTVFPDIRYLGVIDRDKSHHENPTVEGLRSIKGDFQKGMYAHALVDIKREKLISNLGIYDLVEENKYSVYAMKFIEDEFTYNLIKDWDKYKDYLNTVLDEEKELVSEKEAERWHSIIRNYFSQSPSEASILAFVRDRLNFEQEVVDQVLLASKKIKSNPKAMDIIRLTYDIIFMDEP